MFPLLLLLVCPSFSARTFYAPSSPIFGELMQREGWEKTPVLDKAKLVWTRQATRIDEDSLVVSKGTRWLNRVTGSNMLTDKGHLHSLLASSGLQHLAPLTFDLSNRDEREAFWAEDRSDTVWVKKVPDMSRGIGVVIDESLDRLREQTGGERVLVQRFFDNPFLINNRKMELRMYWMLASLNAPYLVLLHPNATVRVASEVFVHGRTDNRLAHVLNPYQQKSVGNHEVRKWDLRQLVRYMEDKDLVPDGEAWLEESLFPYVESMLGQIMDAARPYLMNERRKPVEEEWDGRFELLGMDILLDANLAPTLLELQRGPGLSLDSVAKREVIPKVIRDTVRVVEALGAGQGCDAAQGTEFRVVRAD